MIELFICDQHLGYFCSNSEPERARWVRRCKDLLSSRFAFFYWRLFMLFHSFWYKYFLGKCIHDISPPYAEEETAAKAVWKICAAEDNNPRRRRCHSSTFWRCKVPTRYWVDCGTRDYITRNEDEIAPSTIEKFYRFKVLLD